MLAGKMLVDTLVQAGVTHAFTVPGESFLVSLEGLRQCQDVIKTVSCRHEAGATFAATAFGRLTARPAVVFVSRGPGAANAAIGVHSAWQESIPMILCVGDVPTPSRGREAFQEVEAETMFQSLAKAVFRPETPGQVAAYARKAFQMATTGRPGPVVISLARDVADMEAPGVMLDADMAPLIAGLPPADQLFTAARLIEAARYPAILAGELLRRPEQIRAVTRLAERCGAPVMTCYRQQDHFPASHPAYAGHLDIDRTKAQKSGWDKVDLVVAVGARLDGITTENYRLLDEGEREWIAIHPEPSKTALPIGHVGLMGEPAAVIEALLDHVPLDEKLEKRVWRDRLRQAHIGHTAPGRLKINGSLDLSVVAATTREVAGDDAIIITDAGSFARWIHLYTQFEHVGAQAGPMSGAMGYAVPAGLGAALAKPDVPVVAFCGDGGFLMTASELATIKDNDLNVVVIVCDNGSHGSIKSSQTRRFGRSAAFAVDLDQPDIAALAVAFGWQAQTVDETPKFKPALEAVLRAAGPALIHLKVHPDDIAPRTDQDSDTGPDAV